MAWYYSHNCLPKATCACHSALWRLWQEDCWEFDASLDSITIIFVLEERSGERRLQTLTAGWLSAASSLLSALSTPCLWGTWPQTWTMACCMSSLSKSTPPAGEARWFWTRQACLSKALPAISVTSLLCILTPWGECCRDTREGGCSEWVQAFHTGNLVWTQRTVY